MEKMARIPLKNGNWKYFYGENAESEANAYEANLKLKEEEEDYKQKCEQEERAKRVAKAEAERKEKEERKLYRYNQVLDKIDSLNKVIESYEKETGDKLEIVTLNGKLIAQKADRYADSPFLYFSTTDSHDDWWNKLYKAIREA